jgi:hypothetical protein
VFQFDETLPCSYIFEADELKKNYENSREAAKQPSIPTKKRCDEK